MRGRIGVALWMASWLAGCDVAMGEDWQQTAGPTTVGPAPRREVRGLLGFGDEGAVEGTFGADLETHAWIFEAPRGAVVALEARQREAQGTMPVGLLDLNLTVYGPQRVDGGFGEIPIGHDDDSGGSGQPWLEDLLLPSGGRPGEAAAWLVVVGTNEDRGRGSYRLRLTCAGGVCEQGARPVAGSAGPQEVAEVTCPEPLVRDVIACLGGLPAADLAAPWGGGFEHGLGVCGAEGRVAAWCGRRYGGCVGAPVELSVACQREVRARLLDNACVFGRRFVDALEDQEAVVVTGLGRMSVAPASGTLDSARLRWLGAMIGAEGGAAQLLEGDGVTRHSLWDSSGRVALEALTVGGGRAGAVFYQGSEAMAAEVRDGLILGCGLRFGPERRRCGGPEHCEAGLRCVGMANGWGRCVDSQADTQKLRDLPCASDAECGEGEGLVCAGLGLREHGRCVPTWQRGRFFSSEGGEIPDGDVGGQVVELVAFGIPGEVGDLSVALEVEHPRIRDLRVTLENLDHGGVTGWGELVLFAGERDGAGLVLDWTPVPSVARDLPASGRWRLRVQDLATGARGRVVRAGLEVTGL